MNITNDRNNVLIHANTSNELLFVCHRLPYPPNKGDKIRSYNMINFLKQNGWRIHLATLYESVDELIYSDNLNELCESISIVKFSNIRKLLCPIALLKKTSLSVECFRNVQLQKYIDTILVSNNISAAMVVSAPMAEYLRSSRSPLPSRMVLDLVDVDSEKWREYARRSPWPVNQVYRLEARLHGRYEHLATEIFDTVLLATDAEASIFNSLYGQDRKAKGLSNGVDLDYFTPQPCTTTSNSSRIVFCGAMNYQPNIDAVTWFANTVFPIIRQHIPNAVFSIIGSKPTGRVRALANRPGVEVTGTVADVRDHVAPASLSVAPIRIARGVQNKVLEAMAMGKAVLATPQAFEGIDAVAGQDIAVADDDPDVFAQAALKLLRDPDAAAAMGAKARICMEQRYCWAERLAPLNTLLGQ